MIMLKQAKYNNDLYVIEKIPYEITEDTDVEKIYVPMDSVEGYNELNPNLPIEGYKFGTIKVSREPFQDYLEVICTSESNAPLMTVLHTKGLAANEDYMTLAEAKSVTNEQLDGLLNGNTTVETFNEFQYFTGVTKVGSSDDVEASKTSAPFRMCTSLKEITLPPTVKELGSRAFDQTRNVEYINGIERVKIYGNACLQATWSANSKQVINTLTIDQLKGNYQINNVLFGNYNIKHIVLHDDNIGFSSLNGLFELETISIPDTVTTIGGLGQREGSTLTGFKNLRRMNSDIDGVMNIPNQVTQIGYQSLYVGGQVGGNSEIKEINIPDSVITIGQSAIGSYYGCERLNIGSGIQEIQSNALFHIGLNVDKLTMTIKAVTPPTWDGKLIDVEKVSIYVPSESVETYKAASGWSNYADKIYPIKK